jgi:hypothetical protein
VATIALLTSAPVADAGTPQWTIQPTPRLPQAGLSSIDCLTVSHCTAVGNQTKDGNWKPLVEVWNGTAWTVQPSPDPAGDSAASLDDIVCHSRTWCMATGTRTVKSTNQNVTLAESWNGTRWTSQPTVNQPDSTGTNIESLACPTTSMCIAVGSYETGADTATWTFSETWNGTQWTVQSVPSPSNAQNDLNSVSCTSPTACTAVGGYGLNGDEVPLTEFWNGTRWTIQPNPTPPATNNITALFGTSCPAKNICIAVGYSQNASTNFESPLVETWNGNHWTVQHSPGLGPNDPIELRAVSCETPSSCTAVGNFGFFSALADTLTGGHWIPQPTPALSGNLKSSLLGVSCPTSVCTAVGYYIRPVGISGEFASLAERRL